MPGSRMVVFVHGWSVRSTDTYGKLPDGLKADGAAAGLNIDINHVYVSKYGAIESDAG